MNLSKASRQLLALEIPEYAGRDLSVERQILGSDVGIRRFTWTGDEQALIDASAGADCILTDFAPLTATVIARLGDCKLISVAATGFGCVDVAAAAESGISVCAIDEYCTAEVADHAIMLMLAIARKLRHYDQQVQNQRVWKFDTTHGLVRLETRTLGLIGFGRIGQAVAKRAAGFGLRVIAHDPYANPHTATAMNVALCDFKTVLSDADIVSLHCAETADNHAMIGREAFSSMRRTPILINVARGALVDEHALVNALDSGQISAAGLDVLGSESPDLVASNLLNRDNVILTPHTAFYSDDAILDSRKISAANIHHFFCGEFDKVRRFIHDAQ